ncbi:MAG TPA: hypothetical protein PKD54_12055, partial [Pirellulaceae bacterium]|nr:hypothetical protein [Pirellulaceae bacterium]
VATADRGWVGITCQGYLVARTSGRSELVMAEVADEAPLQTLVMADGLRGWAAGQRGTMLETIDGGLTWRPLPGWSQHQQGLLSVHFQSIAYMAGHLWLVGDPGDVIWQFELATGKLKQHQPGTSTVLNRIVFLDSRIGWTIGAGGQIARTTDGGQTWEIVRTGESEVTLLAVSLDSGDLAFEALARLTTEDGFLAASLVLHWLNNDLEPSGIELAAQRLGVSLVLRRQLSPAALESETSFRRELVHHITRTIRRLRPRVLLCNSAICQSPTGSWIDSRSILEEAVRRAADRNSIDADAAWVHDQPWQVDRIAIRDADAVTPWHIYADQTLPRVGETIGDHVALSRALAGLPMWDRSELTFQVIRTTALGLDQGNLLGGLSESGRRLPRRQREQVQRGNLSMLKQVQNKDTNKKALLKATQSHTLDIAMWTKQILDWTASADYHCAGVWLIELAQDCLDAGKIELAVVALNTLTDRYPDHPLAPAAHRWLVQVAASVETHIARETMARLLPATASPILAVGPDQPPAPPTAQLETSPINHEVVQVSWESNDRREERRLPTGETTGIEESVSSTEEIARRASQQTAWQLNRLRAAYPELAATDEIRWSEANVARLVKKWSEVQPLVQSIMANRPRETTRLPIAVWGKSTRVARVARQELDLQAGRPLPSPVMIARRLESRPLLDGRLDDDVWSELMSSGGATFMRMNHAAPFSPTGVDVLMVAYDDEFLFVACRCQKVTGHTYRTSNEPRTRDADLKRSDRLSLSFDLDRDGAWPLTIEVDARGWTRDSVGATRAWDPQWFVAAAADQSSWTVEMAIPWNQLGDWKPASGDVWGLGCNRHIFRDQNVWDWPAGEWISSEVEACVLMPRLPADRWGRLRFE